MEKALQGTEREKELEKRIGYVFKDTALLQEALTHKSFSNEQLDKNVSHNERLEFLGDAVLDLVIGYYIYRVYPDLPEGEMTRIRSEVVSEKGLAAIARPLALGGHLRLGKGEARSGGQEKDSLISNAMEAVLGAVFCDGGFEKVQAVIEDLFAEPIKVSVSRKFGVDNKTRLQETLQAQHGQTPLYVLTQTEGPDHLRSYTVEVRFDGQAIGKGKGRTKKGAEQEAAGEALKRLEV